jgi:hypothetical protein
MPAPRPLRSAVLAFSLLLGSAALAQVDPRAEALLDNLGESFAHLEGTVPDTFETFDLTLCMTFYEAGEAQPEMCTRMVMDRTNRRMMQETHMTFEDEEGSEEHVTKIVYKDGQLRMRDSFSEEPFALPESEVAALEATFESIFDGLADLENMIPTEFERATYDGEVKYGGVLVGEQVTATTLAPTFMTGGTSVQETTLRFVFGEEGQLIGSVSESAEGEIVTVYDDSTGEQPISHMFNGTSYLMEGDEAVITNRNRLANLAVNEPLDEALFELGETLE